jgi:cerevisin
LNILSTWTGSNTSVNTISGTSMASPHTAGMLAYLLSIYPSKDFDPDLTSLADGHYVLAARSAASPITGAYAAAHAVLPSWMSAFLPAPALLTGDDDAVSGPKTLNPAQLKKALLALSTRDVLATLPTGSPNLLIFNNATA